MGRARKRHIQTELDLKRDKNGQRRGRSNKRAGRKPNGPRAGVSHRTRAELDRRQPLHVTLRVTDAIGWLRRLDMYAAIRRALRVVSERRNEFRIVHMSVQNTHLHMICEANNKGALTLGMQSFQISAAKHLNAAYSRRRRLPLRRRGRVFTDRYHATSLDSPTRVRNALSYVINNWRRHQVDRDAVYTLDRGRLDPYASGIFFAGWRRTFLAKPFPLPDGYEPPLVAQPESWLLRVGWSKARPIGMFEVPGPDGHAIADA